MGLRFRRRVTILPGVSLNISKSGLGISAGPRGARVGVGPRGVYRSLGLPGTGLHYREETSWGALRDSGGRSGGGLSGTGGTLTALLRLHDDGTVDLVGEDGAPLPPRLARKFRKHNAAQVDAFMERAAERWNAGIEDILQVHLGTPEPREPAVFRPNEFQVPKPDPFLPQAAGFLGLIWPPRRERIDEENAAQRCRWERSLADWRHQKQGFDAQEARRREDHEIGRFSAPEAMERIFGHRLASLSWPRETHVSFQIRDEGSSLLLDVDLPEIADMPREQATPAARGLRLRIRTKSDTQVRREYKRHIHGVLFRIVGEAMHLLPKLEEVVASGYSQRPDPTTGNLQDDYLLSARITRASWEILNFQNLEAIDVVACFDRFDLRRNMSKTGIFRPIDPHLEGAGPIG